MKHSLTDKFIQNDMNAFLEMYHSGTVAREVVEAMSDARLVSCTSTAMAERLTAAREQGKSGWWNSEECSITTLKSRLKACLEGGDMIDVVNLAAMIHIREVMDGISA